MVTNRILWRSISLLGFIGVMAIVLGTCPAALHAQGNAKAKDAKDSKDTKEADAKTAGSKLKPTALMPQLAIDGVEAFSRRQYKDALDLLEKAKKEHPHLAPAKVMMAQLFLMDRDPQVPQAKILLEQAVAEEENDANPDPEAHLWLGEMALRERRLSDAKLQFAAVEGPLNKFKGNAERKKNLEIRYWLGLASLDDAHQRWEAMDKNLAKILELQPDNAGAQQMMAKALFLEDKPDEAYKHLVAAVKADKNMQPAALGMAQLYSQSRTDTRDKPEKAEAEAKANLAKVREWISKAMAEAPKDPKPHLAMAQYHWNNHDVDRAQDSAQKALQLDPKSPATKILCGLLARYQKDYKASEDYLQDVFQEYPSNFEASNELALTLIAQKDNNKHRKAFELAKVNFQKDQQNAEAASTFGWILLQLGDIDSATKVMQIAASSRTISRDTAYFLARLQYARGGKQEAQQLLNTAIDSKGGPFAYLDEAKAWKKDLDKEVAAAAAEAEKTKATPVDTKGAKDAKGAKSK